MKSDPMDNPALVAAAETCCLAESPGGYLCIEVPNHDGWHRAELDGELLATWRADA